MQKLNQRKIRWIIREIERGRRIKEVTEIQGVTRVRVWQLYREHMSRGETPESERLDDVSRRIMCYGIFDKATGKMPSPC